MADLKQIQFKRSKTAGARPTTSQIAEGELAINLKDRTFFTNDGTQIIDLGFAKGGKIDGDVTQVGNYTQTGNFSTSGDISAKTLLVSSGVESQGDIRANSGVFRTRANAASNAHLWFEGNEVGTGKNFERGVMYAPPQQANAGAINLRVLNGTATDSGQALFSWRGDGDFNIPRDFLGQRARLAIEAVAPTFNGGRLYTRDRTWNQFGTNESYGWNDLVGYTVGQNGALALNYVYKGRAHATATIWHHLIDERTGAENSWYTGSGPENKMYSLASRGAKGHGFYSGSLMVGANNLGEYSGLGDSSIALGDNDTGFKWNKDGDFTIMSNNQRIVDIYSSASKPFYIKKSTKIVHSDNNSDNLFPPNNNALLEVDTSLDGNNAGGNGVTLIGYNSGSRYYHYFRGRGSANFDMDNGVYISRGGLSVTGNISSTGQVQPSNYSNFDSRYQNLLQLGANVNLDTLAGADHAGEYAQHSNVNTSLALNYPEALAGHLTVTSGAGVQQRYHVYNSTRVYLRAKYSSDSWRPWDRVVTDDYLASGVPGSIVSKAADGFRIAYGSYGFFIRNDGGTTYFMLTNSGDQMGTWNGLRPLAINNSSGNVTMSHSLTVGGSSSFNSKLKAAGGLGVGVDSGFSSSAIAIGDSDTGFVQEGDGILNAYANSQRIMRWTTGATTVYKQLQVQGINGPALLLNNTASNQSIYVYLQRAGSNAGYMGFGGSDNNMSFHNYILNTNLQLRASDVYVNRGFYSEGDGNFNNVYIRSDITLKRNFKKIENALDKVDKLDGLIYEKKNSPTSTEYESVEAGIIAQSLQEILPEAVVEKEGVLNVSASGTIALLVNAIKELKARVEYLESK